MFGEGSQTRELCPACAAAGEYRCERDCRCVRCNMMRKRTSIVSYRTIPRRCDKCNPLPKLFANAQADKNSDMPSDKSPNVSEPVHPPSRQIQHCDKCKPMPELPVNAQADKNSDMLSDKSPDVSEPVDPPNRQIAHCNKCKPMPELLENAQAAKNSDMPSDISPDVSEPVDPPSRQMAPVAGTASVLLNEFTELQDEESSNMGTSFQTDSRNLHGIDESVINSLTSEIASLSTQMEEYKTGHQRMMEFVSNINDRIFNLNMECKQTKLELQEVKARQICKSEVTFLKESVAGLQVTINEIDQHRFINDVEISGLPEFEGEQIVHIVLAVATKMDAKLREPDIINASRVGHKRLTFANGAEGATASNVSPQARRRPILLRLSNYSVRADLIEQSRMRRGHTSADLGLPEHEPVQIYINERLTTLNRILFGMARNKRKQLRWKHAWTKAGRIYVRKYDTSQIYLIRTEADLDRVFAMD